MVLVDVYAQTTLCSNSGRRYNYYIHFVVDSGGYTTFLEEQGVLPIRPYMILHLLSEVYQAMGIDPYGEKEVIYARNSVRHPYGNYTHHPALEVVKTGKRYRLDHEVGGAWLDNATLSIPSMVSYIRHLAEEEESVYDQAVYEWPGYNTLNPCCSPSWSWFVQVQNV